MPLQSILYQSQKLKIKNQLHLITILHAKPCYSCLIEVRRKKDKVILFSLLVWGDNNNTAHRIHVSHDINCLHDVCWSWKLYCCHLVLFRTSFASVCLFWFLFRLISSKPSHSCRVLHQLGLQH